MVAGKAVAAREQAIATAAKWFAGVEGLVTLTLDADALSIIEGALQVSSMQVRDIMIPRTQVVTVPSDLGLNEIIELITKASHSRFPVIGETIDNVVGILLAKDLLAAMLNQSNIRFDIKDVVRPATFVPESKRLNVLLK